MTRTLALATLLVTSSTTAQPPIPAHEWSPVVHLELAKAFVAEAGWESTRDWDGIAYVLARRWRQAKSRRPGLRFVEMVHRYCAAWNGAPRGRQRWIRRLTRAGIEPPFWPAHRVDWADRLPGWRAALERAASWAQGQVVDPCRGLAMHFGGPGDPRPRGHRRMDCGETASTFFARTR